MKFWREEGKPVFTLRVLRQGLIGLPQDYKFVCDALPSTKNKIHQSAEERTNLHCGCLEGISGKGEFKKGSAVIAQVELSLLLTVHPAEGLQPRNV